jgi:predicted DNA-binding transcriptional regulator YafY
MSNLDLLCTAIGSMKLVRFYYDDEAPGIRIVEPHMVAYNRKNHIALSGWFLQGESASGEGQGWREYLIDKISSLSVLEDHFSQPRPGYKPDGGKTFHNVQCAV